MATEVHPDTRWERCSATACDGVRTGDCGRCLAHLDEGGRAAYLTRVARSVPVDARGVAIDAALLRCLLDVAPRDACGRPRLRRARFDGASFDADVSFENVAFEYDASFDGATFAGPVSFAGSDFAGNARFGRVTFGGTTEFDAAAFAGQCWFAAATFGGPASFQDTMFRGPAWFGQAVFDTDVRFDRATLGDDVTFASAKFHCHTLFSEVTFAGEARFDEAAFAHEARFDGAAFKGKGGTPAAAVRQAVWAGADLAPWTRRVAAAAVDHALVLAPWAGALILAAALGALRYHGFALPLTALAGLATILLLARSLVEQGRTGQTVGKRRFGLCLVQQSDGTPVGWPRSCGRYVLHLVDVGSCGIGFLLPLWDAKRQTFADKLSGSVVILRARGWAVAGSSDLPRAEGPPPGGG